MRKRPSYETMIHSFTSTTFRFVLVGGYPGEELSLTPSRVWRARGAFRVVSKSEGPCVSSCSLAGFTHRSKQEWSRRQGGFGSVEHWCGTWHPMPVIFGLCSNALRRAALARWSQWRPPRFACAGTRERFLMWLFLFGTRSRASPSVSNLEPVRDWRRLCSGMASQSLLART